MERALKTDLARTGFPADKYKSHSYRLGWAVTMFRNGLPDTWINAMGGWSRSARSHLRYIELALSCDLHERANMTVHLSQPYFGPHALHRRPGFFLHPQAGSKPESSKDPISLQEQANLAACLTRPYEA